MLAGSPCVIMMCVLQVLKDKDRLVKRTQLKRSVYRVLGTHDQTTCRKASGEDNGEEESSGQDKHLHNYDQEIFDDDDFYHQVFNVQLC